MRLHLVMALSTAVVLAACATDPAAPVLTNDPILASQLDIGTVAPSAPIVSEAECRVPDPPPGTIPWSNTAPALESYCKAFWVIQGVDQSLALGFADGNDIKARWFLRLFIPEHATFVDDEGVPLPDGSVVRITVAVHPTLYAVRFGPHGSGFDGPRPAVLKLNYSWAELDKRDAKDLTIYYQATEDESWEPQSTILDKKGNFVSTYLHHFSNYAVAW